MQRDIERLNQLSQSGNVRGAKNRKDAAHHMREYLARAILPDLNLSQIQRAQLADMALDMLRRNRRNGTDNSEGEITRALRGG